MRKPKKKGDVCVKPPCPKGRAFLVHAETLDEIMGTADRNFDFDMALLALCHELQLKATAIYKVI
ncbi:MAG: hypothetical protein JSV60_03905 [Desulfobacterales bacterium]|jgi:hypothetical protein|nr:MAG: hypothetical protein JSV60_03905 [Desulfobacterales bacterium]